jgi:hypothetical protein
MLRMVAPGRALVLPALTPYFDQAYISGAQPKVLVRDENAFTAHKQEARMSQNYLGAT